MHLRSIVLAAAIFAVPGLTYAQFDFHVAGRDVQVHSFASQGFMYSNQNNYMSMPTSDGSFAFTDGGANISTRITDKFRVGAQFYLRNIGELGNWKPTIDWMMGGLPLQELVRVPRGACEDHAGSLQRRPGHGFPAYLRAAALVYLPDRLAQRYDCARWRRFLREHRRQAPGDVLLHRVGRDAPTGFDPGLHLFGQGGWESNWTNWAAARLAAISGGLCRSGCRWACPTWMKTSPAPAHTTTVPTARAPRRTRLHSTTPNTPIKASAWTRNTAGISGDITLNLGTRLQNSIVDQRDWYVAGTYRISKRLEVGGLPFRVLRG